MLPDSAWSLVLLHGHEPSEQLKRAFRIGHLAAASHKGVDALARQPEQPAQIGLISVSPQIGPQFTAELIPERGFAAGAERGATPVGASPRRDPEGLGRVPSHGDGGRDNHVCQRHWQI